MERRRSMTLPPLEELHHKVRAAYVARDLNSYMHFFSSDLRYHQADGRTIGREQLARDVQSQFDRISAVDAASRNETVEIDTEGVVETVTQWGWIATSAFGFLHRLWRLERRGRHRWRQTEDGWKIVEVTVLKEKVVGHGVQLGRSPRLPDIASIEPSDAGRLA
jgi:hypothetical protein